MQGVVPKHYRQVTECLAKTLATSFPVDSLSDSKAFGHIGYLYNGENKSFKMSMIHSKIWLNYYRKSVVDDKLDIEKYSALIQTLFKIDLSLLNNLISAYVSNASAFIKHGYISNGTYLESSPIKFKEFFKSNLDEDDFAYQFEYLKRSDISFTNFFDQRFPKSYNIIVGFIIGFDKDCNIKPMFNINFPFAKDWSASYYIDIGRPEFVYYIRNPRDSYGYTDIIQKSLAVPSDKIFQHIESVMYSRITPLIKKQYGLVKPEIEKLSNEEKNNYIQLMLMQKI